MHDIRLHTHVHTFAARARMSEVTHRGLISYRAQNAKRAIHFARYSLIAVSI